MLRFQRIGHVVAFEFLFLIEENRRAVGAAVQIREAQRRAAPHDTGPMGAAGNQVLPQHGIGSYFGQSSRHYYVPWLRNPRRLLRQLTQHVVVSLYARCLADAFEDRAFHRGKFSR